MNNKIYLMTAIIAFASVGALLIQPTLASAQPKSNLNPLDILGTSSGSRSSATASDIPSASLSCGQVITTSVKLSANLDCASDGLLVQGDNIVIDLNGHTIKGPGPSASKIGVSVAANDAVEIDGPGAITGFQAGVLASGGHKDVINGVSFEGNQIAIFLTGTTGADIENNMITDNQIGMAAHSASTTTFKTNVLNENDLAGVTLVNSGKNIIDTNIIKKSKNGIFNDAQSVGNSITTNTVMDNSGVDLNNGNGLPINVNDGTFTENLCQTSVPDGLCTAGQ
jgi:parallel beta-helix repeat protein